MNTPYESTIFYDLETTGLNPAFDQIVEGAFVRVDNDFNIISTDVIQIKAKPDTVPNPYAFMVNQYDIDKFRSEGMKEFEAAEKIRNIFLAEPKTAISGYNSIAFDNNFIRHLFFKNMMSPYDFEWRNNNGCTDIYKLAQFLSFTVPDTISWKHKEDGTRSLKLTDIAEANGIDVGVAHEALSDVITTIAVAKLIKEKAPRIYSKFLELSRKQIAKDGIKFHEPIFDVSSFNGGENNYGTLLLPICYSPNNANSVICVDLRHPVDNLINMSKKELVDSLFTPFEEKELLAERVGLRQIAVNKQPLYLPMPRDKAKQEKLFKSCGLIDDLGKIRSRMKQILSCKDFQSKARGVFEREMVKADDVYSGLYSDGFIDDKDLSIGLMAHQADDVTGDRKIMTANVNEDLILRPNDAARTSEILIRAKWNNYLREVLTSKSVKFPTNELASFSTYISEKVNGDKENMYSVKDFEKDINEIELSGELTSHEVKIISDLKRYVLDIKKLDNNLRKRLSPEPVESALAM